MSLVQINFHENVTYMPVPASVILITEQIDEQNLLSEHLRFYNPTLRMISVSKREHLDALRFCDLSPSRIVGFCTDIVVPSRVLDAIGVGAYNFHPGPPDYPGWGPATFAIRDGVRRYGATAHVMAPKVDDGEIVGTNMFDVPAGITLPALECMAYAALLQLFVHFAPHLATNDNPLPSIQAKWGARRCTRRAAAAIRDMSASLPAASSCNTSMALR